MTQNEFETLAGYRVRVEDYKKIIEPMYMATELDKISFINTLNKKRFEYIPEKTQEQKDLEDMLNNRIEELEREIRYTEKEIELRENWNDDGSFTNDIKRLKDEKKLYKNRIKALKWVLRD